MAPDRSQDDILEIVIETRTEVKNLNIQLSSFTREVKDTCSAQESRIRAIEISGSKEAADAIKRCESIETQIEDLYIKIDDIKMMAAKREWKDWFQPVFVSVFISVILALIGMMVAHLFGAV